MTRRALTDGSSGWFNNDKAIEFQEASRWDGNNHISLATGSQWDHEVLYFTASGNWVRYNWSQYQHVADSYEQVDVEFAVNWLRQQECFDNPAIEDLPKNVQEQIKTGFAAMEI